MCDVYVTPYLSEAQMTSGTLAYSFGAGRAVVSTPYWHARELLADDRGILVPFADSGALGREVAELLTNDVRRHAMRRRAYAFSRPMTWKQTALRYLDVIDKACKQAAMASRQEILTGSAWKSAVPELRLGHFLAMCDSAGILQHAVHTVPDRAHGYCVDDNARALILACVLDGPDEESLPEELSTRFAAFVQHAWNPDTRRFRNFMGYGRNWLEPRGSEDSHGRTLWALGECARSDRHPARQRWARGLFLSALPPVETFSSPRARAFALLGLDGYCEVADQDSNAAVVRIRLARKLSAELDAVTTPDWVWFEDELAYDNARLPQALIVTGMATDTPGLTQAGLRALTWLMALQKAPSGCF